MPYSQEYMQIYKILQFAVAIYYTVSKMSRFTEILTQNPLRLAAIIVIAYHVVTFFQNLGYAITMISSFNGELSYLSDGPRLLISMSIVAFIRHLICAILLILTLVSGKSFLLLFWLIIFNVGIMVQFGMVVALIFAFHWSNILQLLLLLFEVFLLLIMVAYYMQLACKSFTQPEPNFVSEATALH